MGSRNINPFKHRNVLWRLRAKARTGVRSPGFELAALTVVPPMNPRPIPHGKIPRMRLPTDKLLQKFERLFPDSDQPILVDGRHVSRSVVVVNKQYQLMKEGHSEQAALQLAQKAVEDEERKTLEQMRDITRQAREGGAVPALGTIDVTDERWERFQYWRSQLERKPYALWAKQKRFTLDHWIARKVLGWEAHLTRYLSKPSFQKELGRVREMFFHDVIPWSRQADGPSEEEAEVLETHEAVDEYASTQDRMLTSRPSTWAAAEIDELRSWLEANGRHVIPALQPEDEEEEGEDVEAMDPDLRKARLDVLQYIAFPLLRPEFQAIPSLSAFVSRAVLEVSKAEAKGLLPILTKRLNPSGTPDLSKAEALLSESLPKLVVKTYLTLMLERPFTWRLLRHVLLSRVADTQPEALGNLPELRDVRSSREVADVVEAKFTALSSALDAIVHDDDAAKLQDDIAAAYQRINELHRIAEELLHLEGPGHEIDAGIQTLLDYHHGTVTDEVAIGEALRPVDEEVDEKLGLNDPKGLLKRARRIRDAQKAENDELDHAWRLREQGRRMYDLAKRTYDLPSFDPRNANAELDKTLKALRKMEPKEAQEKQE